MLSNGKRKAIPGELGRLIKLLCTLTRSGGFIVPDEMLVLDIDENSVKFVGISWKESDKEAKRKLGEFL